jgi:hypothetical protein
MCIRHAKKCGRSLSPQIFDWFARAETILDVLTVSEEQSLSKDWRYDTHYPAPQLIKAFTLARLGRQIEAEAELASYCQKRETAAARANLERAMRKILEGKNAA